MASSVIPRYITPLCCMECIGRKYCGCRRWFNGGFPAIICSCLTKLCCVFQENTIVIFVFPLVNLLMHHLTFNLVLVLFYKITFSWKWCPICGNSFCVNQLENRNNYDQIVQLFQQKMLCYYAIGIFEHSFDTMLWHTFKTQSYFAAVDIVIKDKIKHD